MQDQATAQVSKHADVIHDVFELIRTASECCGVVVGGFFRDVIAPFTIEDGIVMSRAQLNNTPDIAKASFHDDNIWFRSPAGMSAFVKAMGTLTDLSPYHPAHKLYLGWYSCSGKRVGLQVHVSEKCPRNRFSADYLAACIVNNRWHFSINDSTKYRNVNMLLRVIKEKRADMCWEYIDHIVRGPKSSIICEREMSYVIKNYLEKGWSVTLPNSCRAYGPEDSATLTVDFTALCEERRRSKNGGSSSKTPEPNPNATLSADFAALCDEKLSTMYQSSSSKTPESLTPTTDAPVTDAKLESDKVTGKTPVEELPSSIQSAEPPFFAQSMAYQLFEAVKSKGPGPFEVAERQEIVKSLMDLVPTCTFQDKGDQFVNALVHAVESMPIADVREGKFDLDKVQAWVSESAKSMTNIQATENTGENMLSVVSDMANHLTEAVKRKGGLLLEEAERQQLVNELTVITKSAPTGTFLHEMGNLFVQCFVGAAISIPTKTNGGSINLNKIHAWVSENTKILSGKAGAVTNTPQLGESSAVASSSSPPATQPFTKIIGDGAGRILLDLIETVVSKYPIPFGQAERKRLSEVLMEVVAERRTSQTKEYEQIGIINTSLDIVEAMITEASKLLLTKAEVPAAKSSNNSVNPPPSRPLKLKLRLFCPHCEAEVVPPTA